MKAELTDWQILESSVQHSIRLAQSKTRNTKLVLGEFGFTLAECRYRGKRVLTRIRIIQCRKRLDLGEITNWKPTVDSKDSYDGAQRR